MNNHQKILLDDVRPETGPMQFGDDWPGVFIRGDDAIGYASALRRAVEKLAEVDSPSVNAARLADLVELLGSCRVTPS
jgi:hypothetical protein